MTLTSILNEQQALTDLLLSIIERNKRYVANFGYPSGHACPHCAKEAFGTPAILEQLAAAPPGSNLAHEYCVEIADLKAKLAKLQADPPSIHMVQLPNPKAQGDEGDPANPDAPIPEPAPADPANPDAKEDSRASA
jgi:hypothetical protein